MLKRIIVPGRSEAVFIAEEDIGRLVSVAITNNSGFNRGVSLGTTALQAMGVGVSIAGAQSGKPVRVVTMGPVSGVVLTSVVGAGDRLACANNLSGAGGRLVGLNTITPAGSITDPHFVGVYGPDATLSGLAYLASGSYVSGALFVGTSFNTGRVIARALMSGGIGSAIQVYVCAGG